MKNITTGVDRLVELVSEKKKVKLDDAAKELGVGNDTIQEWAEMLEKEGLISINYKLSKTWLEEKKFTEKDVLKVAKEISGEKDALERKITTAIKSLEKETKGFDEVKQEFQKIQKHIKNEIDTVKKELHELEKYETLKNNLDATISKQQKDYDKQIYELRKSLDQDQKKYDDMDAQASNFEKKIHEQEERITLLEDTRIKILKNLDASKKELKELREYLKQTKKEIQQSSDVVGKKKAMAALLKEIDEDHKKINEQQDALINQAKKKSEEIQSLNKNSKKIYDSFEGFFKKKIDTDKYLEEIEQEKKSLKESLEELHKKILLLNSMSGQENLKAQLDQIKKKFEEYESRKNSIKSKFSKVLDYIKN